MAEVFYVLEDDSATEFDTWYVGKFHFLREPERGFPSKPYKYDREFQTQHGTRRDELMAEMGCTVVQHCHPDAPYWVLAIASSVQSCSRGDVVALEFDVVGEAECFAGDFGGDVRWVTMSTLSGTGSRTCFARSASWRGRRSLARCS